ncbi:aminoglycoside phosphotransferase family protein [Phytomonospora endophytica]|uniref:Aminoglycoside phosphotransferase (APT) family kinase protein n=1 Tax=Phytomonospora endophytica TaxID=714109 RepID=A0A841FU37_9ACTN|nr:aminoglycoside phosphotransferase family protein [Phytomonospora endophytica]MBB6037062.1 aminoglycoside phosphotransferase (APT) family kinase protein [Phytomonospora endophytica]GIG69395.1 aminoglycoside phosphotransferase [Phytomonospora endophytica]
MIDKRSIDEDLARALVAGQFPEWRDLPVRTVERQGWDNRTFRLGDELSVRLPSAEGYVAGVAKEDRWLPVLAGHLDMPVPAPVAVGKPAEGYPFPWSVRRWLPGATVLDAAPERTALARDVGAFLVALREVPADGGPVAGRHSFFRGSHPSAYADEVQNALAVLDVDSGACREIWHAAMTSVWTERPVWFHGDVAVGNLLATGGRLSAVIDFGTCGVGDPACDLVMAWTHFEGGERAVFREAAGLDDDTWRRARGWALWKSLAVMAFDADAGLRADHTRVLTQVLADPVI